jgi:hypothetical protein
VQLAHHLARVAALDDAFDLDDADAGARAGAPAGLTTVE